MSTTMQQISPCLWFNSQAEEAAKFYAGISASRVMEAIMKMVELDIATRRKAQRD